MRTVFMGLMALLALGARVSTAADECLTLLEVPLEFEQYDAIENLSNKLFTSGERALRRLQPNNTEVQFLIAAADVEGAPGDHLMAAFAGDGAECYALPYRVAPVNECTSSKHRHRCDKSALCQDTYESYECLCKEGELALPIDGHACAGANSTSVCCKGREECKAAFRCAPDERVLEMEMVGPQTVVLTQGDSFQDESVVIRGKNGLVDREAVLTVTYSDPRLNLDSLDEIGEYSVIYSLDTSPVTRMRRVVVQDINECEQLRDHSWVAHCHRYASCSNTNGGYHCTCNEGLTGDGWDGSHDGRAPSNRVTSPGAVHGCVDTVPPVLQVLGSPRFTTARCVSLTGRDMKGCRRDYGEEVREKLQEWNGWRGFLAAHDVFNGRRVELTDRVELGQPRLAPPEEQQQQQQQQQEGRGAKAREVLVQVPLSVADEAGNVATAHMMVKVLEVEPSLELLEGRGQQVQVPEPCSIGVDGECKRERAVLQDQARNSELRIRTLEDELRGLRSILLLRGEPQQHQQQQQQQQQTQAPPQHEHSRPAQYEQPVCNSTRAVGQGAPAGQGITWVGAMACVVALVVGMLVMCGAKPIRGCRVGEGGDDGAGRREYRESPLHGRGRTNGYLGVDSPNAPIRRMHAPVGQT